MVQPSEIVLLFACTQHTNSRDHEKTTQQYDIRCFMCVSQVERVEIFGLTAAPKGATLNLAGESNSLTVPLTRTLLLFAVIAFVLLGAPYLIF